MDIRLMGLDTPLFRTLNHILNDTTGDSGDKSSHAPTRTYVRDAKAMAATSADVKEYSNSYVFILDMPGLKSGQISVQMERRIGKFMRKFALPENANIEKISAICQDGVLTVSVEKLPPPEPKKPKTIEVQIA